MKTGANAFIVSSSEGVESAFHEDPAALFLCTNLATQANAAARGARSVLLDEQTIQAEYRAINRWGYEKLLALVNARDVSDKKRLFLDANFYDLKTFFMRPVKYILTLERVLKESGVGRLVLIENRHPLLAMTLEYACAAGFFGAVEFHKNNTLLLRAADRKKGWRSTAARIFGGIPKPSKKHGGFRILVSGSLGHLSPLLAALRKEAACEILYVSAGFNFETYRHCITNGYVFHAAQTKRDFENPFADEDIFPGPREAVYGDKDLTPLLNTIFRSLGDVGFLNPHFDFSEIEALFKEWRPDVVILDEDVALRRVFYAFANGRRTVCAVMSHGVPIVRVLQKGERPANGYYGTGATFVNAAIEKDGWESLFYDPMKLAVTGVPRYDALRRERKAVSKPAARHVLFCASIAVPYDWAAATSISSLLGQRGFSREYFLAYVHDLVRLAGEDQAMRLTLKPHYEEPGLWKEVWDKIPRGLRGRIRIAKASEDIFKLESEASLIVTQASSVVCEAVALDKPVILLNYPQDDIAGPFTEKGVAKEVVDYAGLKMAAADLLSGGPESARMADARAHNRKELVGEFDGNNSRRAAQWIRNAWLKH